MDALFDLLGPVFPFVIVAIVVVTRVYSLVRKLNRDRRPAQDRNLQRSSPRSRSEWQDETGSPAPLAKSFQSWEDEIRDTGSTVTMEQGERAAALAAALKDEDNEEEAFSAWNLSVDEPPPAPSPVPKPVSDPRPDSFRSPAPLFRTNFSQPVPEPLFPKQPEETRLPETAPQASVTADIPDGRPGIAAGKRAAGKLSRSLTPLQQGVVWAEILGPPKGL